MLGEDDGYRVGIIMREGLTCEGKGCHYKGKARKAQFPRPVQISITVSIHSLHINSMPACAKRDWALGSAQTHVSVWFGDLLGYHSSESSFLPLWRTFKYNAQMNWKSPLSSEMYWVGA